MIEPVRIVVGYDPRESIAYHVFCQSVLEKASGPVTFLPLTKGTVPNYNETHSDGSNDFTYTRFLVPYLYNYRGWAIFLDGDMICNQDIYKLWEMRDSSKAVMVVKHDYLTKSNVKYLGSKNNNYPRKNWSSVVLWNCGHAKNLCLNPELISSKDGAFLHRFKWLEDSLIGELPKVWNWLATEYESISDAQLIHYTLGTPCFSAYSESEMAFYWHETLTRTLHFSQK